MAYLKNLQNEDPNLRQATSTGAANVQSGGTVSDAQQSGGGTAPQSGWVNLQQYLDVNKGQVGGLADQVTKDVNGQVDSFKNTDSSGVVGDINKSTQTDMADDIKKDVVTNADKAKAYLGKSFPFDASPYTQGIADAGRALKNDLGKVDDQSAQQARIGRLWNDPAVNQRAGTYTSGFGALDSFLLFGDQGAKEKLAQVKGRSSEIDPKVADYTSQINTGLASAKDTFGRNQQGIRDAITSRYNDIYKGAQGRVEAEKARQYGDASKRASDIFNANQNAYGNTLISGIESNAMPYIKANDNFGVANVLTDPEVEALNRLASIDSGLGLGSVKKDSGSAYSFDDGAWDKMLKGIGDKRKGEAEAAAAAAKEATRARNTGSSNRAGEEDTKAAVAGAKQGVAQTANEGARAGEPIIETKRGPAAVGEKILDTAVKGGQAVGKAGGDLVSNSKKLWRR